MSELRGCHYLNVIAFKESDLCFLADHLPGLTNLTRLDLGKVFDLGKLCSHYTWELGKSLEALTNLKSLTVEMSSSLSHVHLPCPGHIGLKLLTVHNHFGQPRNVMTHYGFLTNLVTLDISNNSNLGQELCQPPSPENVGRRPCTCTVMSLTDGSELALLIYLVVFKANFQQCYITDQALQNLSGLLLLQKVELAGCVRLTDEGVSHLSKLTALQELDLYKCNKVTDESVLALASGLQALTVLNVAFVGHIGSETLEQLGNMSALTHLMFDGLCDGLDALRLRRPSLLIETDFTDNEEREYYGD
jgi:Leucine-rich repeat (LRR) protein